MTATEPATTTALPDLPSTKQLDQQAPAKDTSTKAAGSEGETASAARQRPNKARQTPPSKPQRVPDVTRLLGLSVPLTIVLAERMMPVEAILEMTLGTIIEFETLFDSELFLRVANRTIGRGQAVKVGENFGLRITAIDTVAQRIGALGGP